MSSAAVRQVKPGTAKVTLSGKQRVAWTLLEKSAQLTDIYYGGGAGGGKTWLGCSWQVFRRLAYPETRGVIFRKEKKRLKETTMVTLHRAAKQMGLIEGFHYDHPGTSDTVRFRNGSTITLLDISARPSDPDYERLGGYEFTDAFGDEAAECPERGVEILMSRVRFRNHELGLLPKTLLTSNPTKRWPFRSFYMPWRKRALEPHQAFVQALLKDNPDEGFQKLYRQQLSRRPIADQRRLLQGRWEFDDDPFALVSFSDVADITRNVFVPRGDRLVTVDVALQGSDNCVLMVWDGWRIERVVMCDDLTPSAVEHLVRLVLRQERLLTSQVIVDSGGVGAWLPDYLKGVRAYVGGEKSPGKERYRNLRSHCGFILARKITDRLLYLNASGCQTYDPKRNTFRPASAVQDMVVEELEKLRRVDDDSVMALVPKATMKEDLGRSPDFLDACLMRAMPEAKGTSFQYGAFA